VSLSANVNSRVAPSFFIERREACSSLFEEAYVCSSTEWVRGVGRSMG
jgi:hypothetical protein